MVSLLDIKVTEDVEVLSCILACVVREISIFGGVGRNGRKEERIYLRGDSVSELVSLNSCWTCYSSWSLFSWVSNRTDLSSWSLDT
jgi:hypothetical protein